MSRFSGKTGTSGPKAGRKNKGVKSAMQIQKRIEAEERNENVLHDRTRKHRLGRCAEHNSIVIAVKAASKASAVK